MCLTFEEISFLLQPKNRSGALRRVAPVGCGMPYPSTPIWELRARV